MISNPRESHGATPEIRCFSIISQIWQGFKRFLGESVNVLERLLSSRKTPLPGSDRGMTLEAKP
jgi:hypothetical protein